MDIANRLKEIEIEIENKEEQIRVQKNMLGQPERFRVLGQSYVPKERQDGIKQTISILKEETERLMKEKKDLIVQATQQSDHHHNTRNY
ncbi:hypothetical protein HYC85_007699 [Camellia sinensis]|uniref:Uncharacterized protein n=1 Tax=Camellia sinensis TaxID=4442 RepID=A0A7J7HPP4_CAMSI|nr:hypothetical protein HYC85_007699 [Camellia sinensis]